VAAVLQGQGVGRAIMGRLQAIAAGHGFGTRLDLVAAPDVVSFYRRLGYDKPESDLMTKAL
jgi:GNAT superfamily N-acetyltransferase